MKSIEIPLVKDRTKLYRRFEMLPGVMSWTLLATPAILSIISPTIAAYFIIAYLLIWFIKAVGLNIRVMQGHKMLNTHMAYDWQKMVHELDYPKQALAIYEEGMNPKWHYKNIINASLGQNKFSQKVLYHAVVIAVYNESREIIEPTIQSVLQSQYDHKHLMVIIAYEQRGGAEVEKTVKDLVEKYGSHFYFMEAIGHPDNIPDEVIGKGGNITYSGWWLKNYLENNGFEYENVIVTTLDADNKPHPQYFAALAYAYIACPDVIHTSFQPVPIFTNNIWDVPAPMRVIATGNSFWNIVLALRPHMLRNFASHAQSMQTLVDTNFWSVRTIVEDGHQFWRTYFRYDGKHEVHPIMVPIYQDAVLSSTYAKTLKAQFVQVRRWAWGASDIAYVLWTGWHKKNHVPKLDLFFKTARLMEGHLSWATAPLLLLLGAFVPLYIAPHSNMSLVANQLPIIASRIQTIAMIGLFISIYYSIKLLPPKPPRYKFHKHLWMLLQWVYMPITTIFYGSFAALYSQTRLMIGKYMGKFDVTEKVVKK